ncbi:hypothetical protein D9615_008318 [Tricholomella constricta]|uniref:Uncharacterized protein n=1 Tax=Tricholomella constricta TaxID=117010 RepID=A0A8H5M566_9AGAR|nr:hypothetical protein D9615_008318 [Tricholomella constricta]
MPPPISLKRSRRGPATLRIGDGLQLEVLAGLRIIEKLGTARPSVYDSSFQVDDDLVSSLNWISLLLETDSSISHRDIAIALSAEKGHITLHLAKANGQLPTKEERERLAILMRTLRLSLKEDRLHKPLVLKRFTDMMSEKTLPEIYRKLSRIGTVKGDTPEENWATFLSVLPIWRKGHPKGERSDGFIKLAQECHGPVHGGQYSTTVMIETMKSFIFYDQCKPLEKLNATERSTFTTLVMRLSRLMMHSTFFKDLVSSNGFLRHKLDYEELICMFEMYQRVLDIARYSLGVARFADAGMTYITKVLGKKGIDQFLNGTGGIVAHWIVRSHRQVPRAVYWTTSPSVKVRQALGMINFALDLEDRHLDKMAQRDEVTRLWTKGNPVTPVLHSELQLIRYFERHKIHAVGQSIGMNQPPCWACHIYLQILNRRNPNNCWSMSLSRGRARPGPWMIPPGCKVEVTRNVLWLMNEKIYLGLEEYGNECYDEVMEGDDSEPSCRASSGVDIDSDSDFHMPHS